MKYKLLNQKNACYDTEEKERTELELLYQGGYRIQANMSKLLVRSPNESQSRYDYRCRTASYENHLGAIINKFKASLFAEPLSILPAGDATDPNSMGSDIDTGDDFYNVFKADCDLTGTSFSDFIQDIFAQSILLGKCFIGIDLPKVEDAAINRLQEDQDGSRRAYIYRIDPSELIDWEYDDFRNLKWCIIKRTNSFREGLGSPGKLVDEFRYWSQDPKTGVVSYEIYRTAPYLPAKPPKDGDDVALADSGATTFTRIPLVEFVVPDSLWVGNKLEALAKGHLQRRSTLNCAEDNNLFAVGYIKQGSEIGAPDSELPSEVQQDPNRGSKAMRDAANKNFVILGKGDEIGFTEPTGRAYEIVDKQLNDSVDRMYQIVHQMADSITNTTKTVATSADSKKQDVATTNIVLTEFGKIVRRFTKLIFDTVSKFRGDDIIWQTMGLENYGYKDRQEILNEAMALQNIEIPSITFKKIHYTQVALSMLDDKTAETQHQIKKEIDESFDEHGFDDPVQRKEDVKKQFALGDDESATEEPETEDPSEDSAE